MNSSFFLPGPAEHAWYRNIRDVPALRETKEKIETFWARYEPYADQHFRVEAKRDFHARFWEMYLTCTVLEWAQNNGCKISSGERGPDVLVTRGDERCWVEAVTVTDGELGHPDSVPRPPEEGAERIPEDKTILRYTAAIQQKYKKWVEYRSSGLVQEGDRFVPALNTASLVRPAWLRGANDCPAFLKALYPIGQYTITLDRDTGEVIRSGNEPRFEIAKANGTTIPTTGFMDESWCEISAVLVSGANPSYTGPLGFDFGLALNPHARNSLNEGAIPAAQIWYAEMTDDGAWLKSRQPDAPSHNTHSGNP